MDDFFVRALLGGIGVAAAAGPVGCFVVWRRMAYFGAALAHSVLLGIALGFLLDIEPIVAVFAMCLAISACLLALERQPSLSVDALLGVLAHAVFAAGLIVISFMERLRVDLIGYLFGDILSIGLSDLAIIAAMVAVSLALLVWQWRNLLSVTVHEDLARVEGVPTGKVRLLMLLLISGVVAVGIKIVGLLLVVSLAIIPAAAARRLSATPEQMALAAAGIAIGSVILGLLASLQWDVPAGPAIVMIASAAFCASFAFARGRRAPPG